MRPLTVLLVGMILFGCQQPENKSADNSRGAGVSIAGQSEGSIPYYPTENATNETPKGRPLRQAVHGGQIARFGPYHLEFVQKPNYEVELYFQDATGAPLEVQPVWVHLSFEGSGSIAVDRTMKRGEGTRFKTTRIPGNLVGRFPVRGSLFTLIYVTLPDSNYVLAFRSER